MVRNTQFIRSLANNKTADSTQHKAYSRSTTTIQRVKGLRMLKINYIVYTDISAASQTYSQYTSQCHGPPQSRMICGVCFTLWCLDESARKRFGKNKSMNKGLWRKKIYDGCLNIYNIKIFAERVSHFSNGPPASAWSRADRNRSKVRGSVVVRDISHARRDCASVWNVKRYEMIMASNKGVYLKQI